MDAASCVSMIVHAITCFICCLLIGKKICNSFVPQDETIEKNFDRTLPLILHCCVGMLTESNKYTLTSATAEL